MILTAVISGLNGRTAAHAARSAADAAGRAAAGSNKASTQLETWRKREESLVNLRWAADLALSDDAGKKQKGVDILTSLSTAALVQAEDLPFITAVGAAVVAPLRGTFTRRVGQGRSDA